MNTSDNAQPTTEPRPLYWSLRRELYESRSVYLAPLIVAAVVLFASSISMMTVPHRMKSLAASGPAQQHDAMDKPIQMAPAPIMLATFVVGFFYSLDALYGERRDRSILFWKSLPVSDRTTVLAKALIPLAVLPAVAFALSVVVQVLLLVVGAVVLLGSGSSPAIVFSEQ